MVTIVASVVGTVCLFIGFAGAVGLAVYFENQTNRMAATPEAKRKEELAQAKHNLEMLRLSAEEAKLIAKMQKD